MSSGATGDGRSLLEMLSDRLRKQGWYDTPAYWDMKASTYQGLARSNWPNNRYNEHVHRRQMATIDELLGDVEGATIADVGCGTGRTAAHFARRGAVVTGFDFSAKAIEAAKAENPDLGIDFRVGNVFDAPDADRVGHFDVVMVLGCLTLACKDADEFERAVDHVVALAKPGGRVLFLEPIHRSRLLRRILRMSVAEWVERCGRHGLGLIKRGGICFVPSRIALAYRDLWPEPVVEGVFDVGEAVLDTTPLLERFADYKYLLFRKG